MHHRRFALLAALALSALACSSEDTTAGPDPDDTGKAGSSGKKNTAGSGGAGGSSAGSGGAAGKGGSGGSSAGGSEAGGGQAGSAQAGSGGSPQAGSGGSGGSAAGAGGSDVGGQGGSSAGGQAGQGGQGSSGTGGAVGSNGSGGPGPGTHSLTSPAGAFEMYVPASYTGAPTPLLLLLHGQGDTGSNMLKYWKSKGLAGEVLIAAPDDNTDLGTVTLYDHLLTQYNVDTKRGYVFGHSQGGAYAAFLLFKPTNANRFAGLALNSSGLAKNPGGIPSATPQSPAVAICIDPKDPNNTGSLDGSTDYKIMENFATLMQQKGYTTQLTLHNQGHTIPSPETSQVLDWLLKQTKP